MDYMAVQLRPRTEFLTPLRWADSYVPPYLFLMSLLGLELSFSDLQSKCIPHYDAPLPQE